MCATLLAAFFMFKSLFAKIQATNRKDANSQRKVASLDRQAHILESPLCIEFHILNIPGP